MVHIVFKAFCISISNFTKKFMFACLVICLFVSMITQKEGWGSGQENREADQRGT